MKYLLATVLVVAGFLLLQQGNGANLSAGCLCWFAAWGLVLAQGLKELNKRRN